MSQFTHQNGNNWAGPISTAMLFLGCAFGSLYSKLIGKYPFRYTFFVGSIGNTCFILLAVIFLKIGFTFIVEILLIFGSLAAGVVVSLFYTSQYHYINVCSLIDNQKSKYFAINLCIGQSANMLGNIISAILI